MNGRTRGGEWTVPAPAGATYFRAAYQVASSAGDGVSANYKSGLRVFKG